MKKILLISLFICLFFSNALAYDFKTVDEVAIWLKEGFTYQNEEEGHDHWKYPNETLEDRGGDCEDFAILVQDVLREQGIKVHIFVIVFDDITSAHAMAFFRDDDGIIHYFSNNNYKKTNRTKLSDVLYDYYGDNWNYVRSCHKAKFCSKKFYKGDLKWKIKN
jgi:transglutaminase-like putative cysteine protease